MPIRPCPIRPSRFVLSDTSFPIRPSQFVSGGFIVKTFITEYLSILIVKLK